MTLIRTFETLVEVEKAVSMTHWGASDVPACNRGNK